MARCTEYRQVRSATSVPLRTGSVLLAAAAPLLVAARLPAQALREPLLPQAPSALLAETQAASASALQDTAAQPAPQAIPRRKLPLCPDDYFQSTPPEASSAPAAAGQVNPPCREEDPLQFIVTSAHVKPLTVGEKGLLAARDILDPFNLITIAGSSAITVAAESHSAYGPGFPGFGRLAGYSLSEDIIGESVGTFAIPSIAHEDPRYHRMPDKPVPRRLLHAVLHTFISQHDDGNLMPNYAVLLTYPIAAEVFNLYVPGTQTDGASTAQRIGVGIATNPVGDIIAEFLPDLAKRVHVRIVFIQQIMNQVAAGAPAVQ